MKKNLSFRGYHIFGAHFVPLKIGNTFDNINAAKIKKKGKKSRNKK